MIEFILAVIGAVAIFGALLVLAGFLLAMAEAPKSVEVRCPIPRAWLHGIANGEAGRRER